MASEWPPLKNTAYTFDMSVFSQADPTALKSAPTIAAGDFKISTDGSALANLTNLPTASGVMITIVLTAAEMNGDRIFIYWQDAAGAEWISGYLEIFSGTQQSGDNYPIVSHATYGNAQLVRSTTPANPLTVDASGRTVASSVVNGVTLGAASIDSASLASSGKNAIADGILDRADGVETGLTLRQWLRLGATALFSKWSGLGTGNPIGRDYGDTKNRIDVNTDANGNRTSFNSRDAT